jgi:hypothetical protein
MIEDAVARIQAIEQQLKEKARIQLQARLTIRGCPKELRDISGHHQAIAPTPDTRPAH